MNLKIEDVKEGDKLECVNRKGYINHVNGNARIRKQILKGPIVVLRVMQDSVVLGRGNLQIPLESLKYFKKKEQSQYTFKDLITLSLKAENDGAIDGVTIIFNDGHNDRYVDCNASEDKIKQEIDFILSLYKETFVIECEDDIAKINGDARITFANGNISTAVSGIKIDGKNTIQITHLNKPLGLFFLKGATVEQERGCNG